MIDGWLGYHDTRALLRGDFEQFDLFQQRKS
jgi:hypothetical protein